MEGLGSGEMDDEGVTEEMEGLGSKEVDQGEGTEKVDEGEASPCSGKEEGTEKVDEGEASPCSGKEEGTEKVDEGEASPCSGKEEGTEKVDEGEASPCSGKEEGTEHLGSEEVDQGDEGTEEVNEGEASPCSGKIREDEHLGSEKLNEGGEAGKTEDDPNGSSNHKHYCIECDKLIHIDLEHPSICQSNQHRVMTNEDYELKTNLEMVNKDFENFKFEEPREHSDLLINVDASLKDKKAMYALVVRNSVLDFVFAKVEMNRKEVPKRYSSTDAELYALLRGIRYAMEGEGSRYLIFSDSKAAVDAFNHGILKFIVGGREIRINLDRVNACREAAGLPKWKKGNPKGHREHHPKDHKIKVAYVEREVNQAADVLSKLSQPENFGDFEKLPGNLQKVIVEERHLNIFRIRDTSKGDKKGLALHMKEKKERKEKLNMKYHVESDTTVSARKLENQFEGLHVLLPKELRSEVFEGGDKSMDKAKEGEGEDEEREKKKREKKMKREEKKERNLTGRLIYRHPLIRRDG